jgi:hypothetical protein
MRTLLQNQPLVTWTDLPPRIRALLEREGLGSPRAWRVAGARRKTIFGISKPMVRDLDRLARGVS